MKWNPWFDSAAVALLAVLGVLIGRWFSRLPKPYWALGYFIPLLLIVLYGLAAHRPSLAFLPPISWMMIGRNRFAIIGFIATLVLTTPLSRLPQKRNRNAIAILMVLVVWQMSVWPFLAPAFNYDYLSRLVTHMDSHGICRQSNDYNCGPAAAVTALRKLGIPAEEGAIAILAHTSSATGTPPDILARTLRERYSRDGLMSEYRAFQRTDELNNGGFTLAVIKYSFWLDHYVTVLEVTNNTVIVGDPLLGLRNYSHEEFSQIWRHVGVVLRRAK